MAAVAAPAIQADGRGRSIVYDGIADYITSANHKGRSGPTVTMAAWIRLAVDSTDVGSYSVMAWTEGADDLNRVYLRREHVGTPRWLSEMRGYTKRP